MKTLKKALDVLELFTEKVPFRGVTEIAETLSVNKSSVHFILSTFKDYGYVVFDSETRKYGLGYKLYEMSRRISYKQNLVSLCMPEMKKAASSCNEDVSLSIRVGTEWVVIALAEGEQFVGQRIYIGRTLPLYCGGGKCFLAYMEQEELDEYVKNQTFIRYTEDTPRDTNVLLAEIAGIKARGYTESRGEYWEGAAALCFPVLNGKNSIVGVLSMNSTTDRINNRTRSEYISCMTGVIDTIQKYLSQGEAV